MKKPRNVLTLATAAVIVLILILYMITFVVREGEAVVLTTFNKVTRVIERKPGLYWKAPWPIQSVERFDARLHTDIDRSEETKTKDGVLIVVLAYYNWRIEDPELFYTAIAGADWNETLRIARTRLSHLVRDAKNDVFGQHMFHDLVPEFRYAQAASETALTEGAAAGEETLLTEEAPAREVEAGPKFPNIEAAIQEDVNKKALAQYGVEITRVGIMRFQLPEETTQHVFNRMREERLAVAEAIRASGEGEAKKIRSDADRAYNDIIETAEGEAQRIRAEGDKEAAVYYETFAKNEALHNFWRELQSLRVIIDESTRLILSTESAPFELLDTIPESLLPSDGESGGEE
jgi:membrane protease subunit HflC